MGMNLNRLFMKLKLKSGRNGMYDVAYVNPTAVEVVRVSQDKSESLVTMQGGEQISVDGTEEVISSEINRLHEETVKFMGGQ